MQRLLSFLFTMIFFLQTNVWAIGASNPDQDILLQKVAEHINGLSPEQQQTVFADIIKKQTKNDQAYLNSIKKENFSIPHLTVRDGSVHFKLQEQDYSFELLDGTLVKFEGKVIEFGKGKLSNAALEIETLLSKKTSSITDFFISSAHASGISIVLGIMWVILFVLQVRLVYKAFQGMSDSLGLGWNGLSCRTEKEKLSQAKQTMTPEEIKEARKKIQKLRWEIKSHKLCQNNYNKGENKEVCETHMKCVDSFLEELKTEPGMINNSDRGQIKEIKKPSQEIKVEAESSKQ